jgi:hypothetical protein
MALFFQRCIFYPGRENASIDFVYSYLHFNENRILTIILLFSMTQEKRWETLLYMNPSRSADTVNRRV